MNNLKIFFKSLKPVVIGNIVCYKVKTNKGVFLMNLNTGECVPVSHKREVTTCV